MADRKKKAVQPAVSIVIGTLNRSAIVLRLLGQLEALKQTVFEVLVYDQSDEEHHSFLKERFPARDNFKLIRLDRPNTCRYLNLGWKQASAPIVLYFDDDVEITGHTVGAHLKAFEDPALLAVAGRVLNDGEKGRPSRSVGLVRSYGAVIDRNFFSTTAGYVQFPYGCNMSFRKSAIEAAGGFDESLNGPVYAYNEVDLGFRISRTHPRSIRFEPRALVYHHHYPSGGTRAYPERQANYSNWKNYGYFVAKNFSGWDNFRFFLRRLPYQIAREPAYLPAIVAGFIQGKKIRPTPQSLTLAALFAVFFLVRFWRVPDFFIFDLDEEYQALLAWEQVKNFHITFIGVSASNIGFYLGPGLTYIGWLLLEISRGDPVVFGYFASGVGFATCISLYYVLSKLYNRYVAGLATVFYGLSALSIYYDRKYWPLAVPLAGIWFYYALTKMGTKPWYTVLAFALAGLALHLHLSLLLFVPLLLLVILLKRKKITAKTWTASLTAFVLIISPLIVFDFIHNFDNARAPMRALVQLGKGDGPGVVERLTLFINTASNFVLKNELADYFAGIKTMLGSLAVAAGAFGLAAARRRRGTWLLGIFFLLFLTFFILFPGPLYEYHTVLILPFFAAALALFFAGLPRVLTLTILFLFGAANLLTVFSWSDKYGLTAKKTLIQNTMAFVGDRPYKLVTAKHYVAVGGWRYLFKTYGRTPAQSDADPIFGWIYPDEISTQKPAATVTISGTDAATPAGSTGVFYGGMYKATVTE